MSPDNDEHTSVWNIYCELGLIDRHFNNQQSNCRALASTWLLAGFAGIGIVISKELSVQFSKELIIVAIGLASAVGLSLLWMLDLLVYQRMLDSAYYEARELESHQPWLPQVRNNMRDLLEGRSLAMVALFYIVTAETMVLISGVALALWLHKLVQYRFAYWAELSGYALVFVLFPVFMYRRTSTTPDMETNLKKARESRSSPRPTHPAEA
jgi:hypothetical protein